MKLPEHKVKEFVKKVQPIYKMLDWKWEWGREMQVPTCDDLEACLFELAEGVETMKYSGGLFVSVEDDGLEFGMIIFG